MTRSFSILVAVECIRQLLTGMLRTPFRLLNHAYTYPRREFYVWVAVVSIIMFVGGLIDAIGRYIRVLRSSSENSIAKLMPSIGVDAGTVGKVVFYTKHLRVIIDAVIYTMFQPSLNGA